MSSSNVSAASKGTMVPATDTNLAAAGPIAEIKESQTGVKGTGNITAAPGSLNITNVNKDSSNIGATGLDDKKATAASLHGPQSLIDAIEMEMTKHLLTDDLKKEGKKIEAGQDYKLYEVDSKGTKTEKTSITKFDYDPKNISIHRGVNQNNQEIFYLHLDEYTIHFKDSENLECKPPMPPLRVPINISYSEDPAKQMEAWNAAETIFETVRGILDKNYANQPGKSHFLQVASRIDALRKKDAYRISSMPLGTENLLQGGWTTKVTIQDGSQEHVVHYSNPIQQTTFQQTTSKTHGIATKEFIKNEAQARLERFLEAKRSGRFFNELGVQDSLHMASNTLEKVLKGKTPDEKKAILQAVATKDFSSLTILNAEDKKTLSQHSLDEILDHREKTIHWELNMANSWESDMLEQKFSIWSLLKSRGKKPYTGQGVDKIFKKAAETDFEKIEENLKRIDAAIAKEKDAQRITALQQERAYHEGKLDDYVAVFFTHIGALRTIKQDIQKEIEALKDLRDHLPPKTAATSQTAADSRVRLQSKIDDLDNFLQETEKSVLKAAKKYKIQKTESLAVVTSQKSSRLKNNFYGRMQNILCT